MLTPLMLLSLSFGSPTAATVADLDPNLVRWQKIQLQERNRQNDRQVRETFDTPDTGFEFYSGLTIPAAMLNRVFDPENHVSEGFHFDPEKTHRIDFKVKEPFLKKRGIAEVVGVGVSDFAGSSEKRIQNIMQSLSRYDGQIIPAGTEFSFNELLGDVTEEGGYAWERTILNGESSWGIGGGICQVSTNIFRAALNAGLPIAERRAHSYVIDKYGPTGLDATIYKGSQDFKFTNDTEHDMLLRIVRREDHLAAFLLGTRDRQVSLEKASHWEGYDKRVATHWARTIKKNALVVNENFASHYRGTYE